MSFLKKRARQSKAAIICHRIYRNWRMRAKYSRGVVEESIGSTHSTKSIEESVDYIDRQYEDYLKYAGLKPDQIVGKRFLELGFGDSVGVALRLLATGASHVTCLDKFYSIKDKANEREVYRQMRNQLPHDQQSRFDRVIDLSTLDIDGKLLRCVYGTEMEKFAGESVGETFDIILSRAVIEEIYEPSPLFRSADLILRDGGLMIHKIDLSDYGLFSGGGMNPLTFLTIPEWLYRNMASNSGMPNRKLMSFYNDLMQSMGYDSKIFVSSIIGVGELEPYKERIELNIDYSPKELELIKTIRAKLTDQFSKMSDEELLIDGIFLVARKPMNGPRR